jgi:hypothetical protein
MSIDSVSGAGNAGSNNPDPKLIKECGVQFGEDTLKDLKEGNIHTYAANGVLKRETRYEATLTDGTRVSFPKQRDAKIVKSGDNEYDFEKINDAQIAGTKDVSQTYNLMGCQFTSVDVRDDESDDNSRDTINIGNHEDGTKSEGNSVRTDEEDWVRKGLGHAYRNKGYVIEDHDGLNADNALNGRTTKISNNGTKKTYSHDGKLLKDSYVKADEKELSDGYSIKTSPDGTEKWYYDPSGKAISKKEFIEAKHPYKI